MWSTIFLIITISAPLVMVAIEKSNKELYTEKGRPTTAGWWFIGIAVLGAVAGGGLGISNNRAQDRLEGKIDSLGTYNLKKDKEDALKTAKLREENKLQWDSAKGEYRRLDSQTRLRNDEVFVIGGHKSEAQSAVENPLFNTDYDLKPNPVVSQIKVDSFNFIYKVKNIGKGIATNINYKNVSMFKVKPQNIDTMIKGIGNMFNESIVINSGEVFICTSRFYSSNLPDTIFFYIKTTYSNSLKQPQKSLNKIFMFTKKEVGSELRETREWQFNFLKEYLKKKGEW